MKKTFPQNQSQEHLFEKFLIFKIDDYFCFASIARAVNLSQNSTASSQETIVTLKLRRIISHHIPILFLRNQTR